MQLKLFLTALLASLFIPHYALAEDTSNIVIGISGSAADSKSVTSMMSMVRTLGAQPVLLSNHAHRINDAGSLEKSIAKDSELIDAIIIMGNSDDIDPAKYGAEKHPETNIETDLARASYEEAMIDYALNSGMPLFGVCGGHQRINVATGGTLHQHVPDIVGDDRNMQASIPPFIPVQRVTIKTDTALSQISDELDGLYTPTHEKLPPNTVMENSFHHQAIDKLGKGLRVNAVADGIIEGVEVDPNGPYANQFIMGVQWHPEFGASPLSPKLVKKLVEEAKIYREKNPRKMHSDASTVYDETIDSSLNKIKDNKKSALERAK